MAAVDIYAGVAASLAERKKGGQLTEFFRNIKGTIDDDDWDQVLWFYMNEMYSAFDGVSTQSVFSGNVFLENYLSSVSPGNTTNDFSKF